MTHEWFSSQRQHILHALISSCPRITHTRTHTHTEEYPSTQPSPLPLKDLFAQTLSAYLAFLQGLFALVRRSKYPPVQPIVDAFIFGDARYRYNKRFGHKGSVLRCPHPPCIGVVRTFHGGWHISWGWHIPCGEVAHFMVEWQILGRKWYILSRGVEFGPYILG